MYGHGVTLQVLATARDAHGDITKTVRGEIDGCAFAPGSSVENTDNRALVDTRADVYAPADGVWVGPQDLVRILPRELLTAEAIEALPLWHVEGMPEVWANPFTGWRPGRVIHLRLVAG